MAAIYAMSKSKMRNVPFHIVFKTWKRSFFMGTTSDVLAERLLLESLAA
jgi:hypothetical protein